VNSVADTRENDNQVSEACVLVLIDDSPEGLSVMEAAVALARRQRSRVRAIFVEELDLLRSAGYPFASEIGAMSGNIRPRAHDRLSGELKRRIHKLKLALERLAAAGDVPHELIVRRGRVVTETLAMASPADVLVVGRVGWSRRLGRSFGSVPLALARSAPGSVVIWSGLRRPAGRTVAVLAEDSATLDAAIQSACVRARLLDARVTLMLPPGSEAVRADELKKRIESLQRETGVSLELRILPAANPASLLHALDQAGAAELVLSRRGRLLNNPAGVRLLERIRLPVFVAP
jgi:nucleotide-binding universal stress UspA family protein